MAFSSPSETYDVAIIGAGPFGLTLSTILARWGYTIKHIDDRPHPTLTGRADGIQPRSLDLLRNLNLKSAIMSQNPVKIYEVAFWDPAPPLSSSSDKEEKSKRGIVRTGSWASCPKFIDARYPYTTLLHQGHIEQAFLQDMKLKGVTVQRPWRISDFENDGKGTHPVRVEFTSLNTSIKETVRVKYLLDGEGARSFVREKLGIKMLYKDPIAHVWGVLDGVVKTNFPDIRVRFHPPPPSSMG
jgi:2-polyprenyl-6-methoxyphenol hydroxylase-like FAD-dependent oxidoreductase